jgi:hypothetical protein
VAPPLPPGERVPSRPATAPPARRPRFAGVLPPLLLTAATAAAFAGVAANGFISLDDEGYLTGNPALREGLTPGSAAWAFTTFHQGNWHPLTWLSHLLDVELFGLAPGPHHLVSLLIHLLGALLLLRTLLLLTGSRWPSLVVSLLFAVHPLRVESVAWASERKDVLAGALFAAALLAWVRQVRTPGRGRWLLPLGLFALALLAKPMAVTFPLVLLILDLWPLGRLRLPGRPAPPATGALLLEKAPFLLLSLAAALATWLAQSRWGWVKPLERYPLGERPGNAAVAILTYLEKAFWPRGLAVPYGFPAEGHPAARILGGAVVVGAICLAAWLLRRPRPHLLAGWLLFCGMLLPVLGLVQVGDQALADRYTYLPLTGILLASVWAVPGRRAAPLRRLLPPAVTLLTLAMVLLTRRQVAVWRSDETLFRHAVAVTTDNWLAWQNLAATLTDLGRDREALEIYRHLLSRGQDHPLVHNNLGVVLRRMGRAGEAAAHLRRAIQMNPGYAAALDNLGLLLGDLGDWAAAEGMHRRAAELRPDEPRYRRRLEEARSRLQQPPPTHAPP